MGVLGPTTIGAIFVPIGSIIVFHCHTSWPFHGSPLLLFTGFRCPFFVLSSVCGNFVEGYFFCSPFWRFPFRETHGIIPDTDLVSARPALPWLSSLEIQRRGAVCAGSGPMVDDQQPVALSTGTFLGHAEFKIHTLLDSCWTVGSPLSVLESQGVRNRKDSQPHHSGIQILYCAVACVISTPHPVSRPTASTVSSSSGGRDERLESFDLVTGQSHFDVYILYLIGGS